MSQLDYLYKECYKNRLSIYLFIDEYDHFTKTILSEPDHIQDYMSETHGTGYLRRFFNTIKSGIDSSIKRVFVTGVSPVTMDDLTRGFITGELQTGFPAEKICNPNNFVSLLYYFGMITIDGTYRGKTKFVVPNEVVREQIITYLIDTYRENDLYL